MSVTTNPPRSGDASYWTALLLQFLGLVLVIAAVCYAAGWWIRRELDDVYGCRTPRAPVARVTSDMRSMATAIESYFVDFGVYPAHTEVASESFMGVARPGQPTFRVSNGSNLRTMTSPVAYLNAYTPDFLGKPKERTFCYFAKGGGWIVWSPGPDKKYSIDADKEYDPTLTDATAALLRKTYDPTNGTVSGGDVWRVRQ